MRKLIQSVKAFIVLAFTKLKHFYIDSTVKHKEPELYSKEWFIRKFEAIPEEEIGSGSVQEHCALWHVGVRIDDVVVNKTDESTALIKLFGGENGDQWKYVFNVNDGFNENSCLGSTPKERILNKLKYLPDVQAT